MIKSANEILKLSSQRFQYLSKVCEEGEMEPTKYKSMLDGFITADIKNLKLFQKIKLGKGIVFVCNRLEILRKEQDDMRKVIEQMGD